MDVQHATPVQKKQPNHRQAIPDQEEITPSSAPINADNVVHLQQFVGNSGVKQLLAQGKLQRKPSGLPPLLGFSQPQIQRQCTCGFCSGVHEEQNDTPSTESPVQRLADAEEAIADDSATIQDIPVVRAECKSDEEGVGFGNGNGGEISLHGRTDAHYNHGQPIPAPFPDTIEVTTSEIRGTPVFSAHGTFEANFEANPVVTLPPVPGGLTPCQEEAVRTFINGPLNNHEQEHVAAFNDNYDGTPTLSVDQDNIRDTPEMRERAMAYPVEVEDASRAAAANQASNDLDPWNHEIAGLDCEDE